MSCKKYPLAHWFFYVLTSLISNMTLWTLEDPEVAYPSQSAVWKSFEEAFDALEGLVTHAPVFKDYFHEGLLQFYRDNILYVEVRAYLSEVNVCPQINPSCPILLLGETPQGCFLLRPDVRAGRQHPRHRVDHERLPGNHAAVCGREARLPGSQNHLHCEQVE